MADGPLAGPAGAAAPARDAMPGAPLLLALSYYAAARVGLMLTPPELPISLLWPPNALLLAALLLTPPRRWWTLIAAVFPAHLAAELQTGIPLSMVLGWFVSNCTEALIGAAAVRLLRPLPLRPDSFKDIGALLLGGALLAPMLSSFVDAAFVKLVGWGNSGYWELMHTRATSNVLAALIVLPLALALASGPREPGIGSPRTYVEAGLLFAGLAAVSLAVFPMASEIPALFYAPLPFLLWAAVRLGPLGVAAANLLLAGVALFGAINGLGPFVGGTPAADAQSLQYFLVAVTVPLLLLAVLLAERRRLDREASGQRQQITHLSRVATLGGLSGALAHELNQPLTAILGNAQAGQRMLATGRAEPREIAEILGDIVAADRHATDVIHRLRSLLENGETLLQQIDVNHVVRDALELAHGDIARRRVRVVTRLAPGLPPIRTDRVQLQQVLLNLVTNACEAMSAGAADRRVLTVTTGAEAQGEVRISLIDRGPGFGFAEREKLFEPFFTTKQHGLGLGLSISRSIVAAHGGRLWAEGRPGEGAAFHVALPSRSRLKRRLRAGAAS